VKDGLRALDCCRYIRGSACGEVQCNEIAADLGQMSGAGQVAHGGGDGIAPVNQLSHQRSADEAGCTGDERLQGRSTASLS
jgi:hypothetical protein